ncbi:MAG: WYL domain-containing protein [Elusimicrobiales bacterium]|nr:WYL domain-containing protein [Elusimicrobiales bacterium]
MARKKITSQRDTQHFRIINILTRLDKGETAVMRRLAEEYNVSLRAIQRDFDTIEACGYEIEKSGKGGRKFAPGFSLSKARISVEQQAALVTLYQLAANMGSEMKAHFGALFEKLTGCRPDKLEQYVVPVMPVNKAQPKNIDETMAKLESAILHRQLMNVTYLSPRSGSAAHRIGPLKLLVTEGYTYVMGQRADPPHELTVFRLDRIKKCEPVEPAASGYIAWGRKKKGASPGTSDAYFEPRPDAQEILDAAHNIWGVMEPRKKNIRVKLEVGGWAANYFRNQELIADQRITPAAGGAFFFEGRVGNNMEIIPHILRCLPDVRVVSPPDLKAEIETRLKRYLSR